MKTQRFARRPFEVEGVQVTAENLEEVAQWCSGDVREGSVKTGKPQQKYVKVRVLRPLNERQTMAFPGDWILYAGTGYKVYTNKAFNESFEVMVQDDHNYGAELESNGEGDLRPEEIGGPADAAWVAARDREHTKV